MSKESLIYNRLNSVATYHPSSAETYLDWSTEAGDIVKISQDGTEYNVPIMNSTMTWKGSPVTTIDSSGNKKRDAVAKMAKRKYGGSGGTRMAQEQHLFQEIDEIGGSFEQYITGDDGLIHTTMWQNKDNLGAFANHINADGTVEYSSGLFVDENHSSIGFYKDGDITAGFIATTVNGEPSAKILGKNILITTDSGTNNVEDSVSTIELGVDGIRQTVQSTDGKMTQIQQTIEGINAWSQDTEGNLGELLTTAQAVQAKVETTDGKVGQLKVTADGIVSTLASQGETVSEIAQKQDQISLNVNSANGSIGTLQVKADSITQKIDSTDEKVSQLKVTADGLNYTLSQQGDTLATFEANQNHMLSQIGSANTVLSTIEQKADSITQTVTTATGKVNTIVGWIDTFEGSGLYQNRNSITQVVGKFGVDGNGNVYLNDGAELKVTKNGVRQTVGTVSQIDAVGGRVSTIEGSTLWAKRDNITGAVGKMTLGSDGKLHIVEGSGLVIDKSGGSFGVYDSGNLTAGIIVDKINGGTVQIKADKIVLDGKTVAQQFEAVNGKFDSIVTNVAEGKQINAYIGRFNILAAKDYFVYGTGDSAKTVKLKKLTVGDYSCNVFTDSGDDINFNIADTQTYKNGVSASYTNGYTVGFDTGAKGSHLSHTSDVSLGYSDSVTITAKYYDHNGADKSTSRSISITSPADRYQEGYDQGLSDGSGGGSASNIDMSGFNWVDSSSSWSTSGKTKLSTLSSLIQSHKNDRGYIYWTAKINGGTGTKTYYISIG